MSGSDRIGLAGLPRPVAAVVGGGGCLGAAQVGVGVALEERGFVPDLVVGTSVGALNGAIVAAHPGQAALWLAQVWTDLRRRDVFPLRPRIANGGVFSSAGIQELIRRAGLPARVEDLSLPFTAIAMDLITGQQVALSAGDLPTALLASAAIPGALPPVERDGRTLVDGGMIAYVPVGAALAAGAASVVVVSSGPEAWPVAPRRPRLRPTAVAGRAALWLLAPPGRARPAGGRAPDPGRRAPDRDRELARTLGLQPGRPADPHRVRRGGPLPGPAGHRPRPRPAPCSWPAG